MSETRVVHVKDNVPGAVYIGRANGRAKLSGSPFQNPFRVDTLGRQGVIDHFRECLMGSPGLLSRLPELRGKPLACWCRHDGEERTPQNACHGDVLVELLERYSDDELRVGGGCNHSI
jgi:hypothetical protein